MIISADSAETTVPPFSVEIPASESRFSVQDNAVQNVQDDVMMLNSPQINGISQPFVGTWNTLVSRTNWEKGSIILKWRNALLDSGQPKTAYSDEAWAKRVGGVSPQHTGRLRRVAERFEETHSKYPKLYWSHFFAALDWEDAELYLEGAVQNGWSAAQMRIQRWEVNGAPEELKPKDEDVFTAELEEPETLPEKIAEIHPAGSTESNFTEGFDASEPPFDMVDSSAAERKKTKSETGSKTAGTENNDGKTSGEVLAALNNFGNLPDDLREPMELLKVAVLNHKLSNWQEVPAESLCRIFDLLKMLVSSRD